MFAIYAYFVGGYINNPMTNASADLAIAMVDDHSLQIDPYAGNTSDVAGRGGHIYSGFGPGLGFIFAPLYAALKPAFALLPADSLRRMDKRLYDGAVVLSPQIRDTGGRTIAVLLVIAGTLAVAIPLVIACSLCMPGMCRRYAPRLDDPGALAALTLFAFGSLGLAFATNFVHTSVAAWLIWIVVCSAASMGERPLSIARLAALGFALGLAAITDYPAVLFSAYAGAFVLWKCARTDRLKATGALTLGASIPLGSSLLYHFFAFGHALTNAYRFRLRATDQHVFDVSDIGSSLPNLAKLYIAFIGPVSGIVWYQPVVLLGVVVAARWLLKTREPERRAFWALALATMLTNLGIYCTYPVSTGPGCLPEFGIRYMAYSVPFAVVALSALWSEVGENARRARTALVALMILNTVPVWVFVFYGLPVYPERGYASLFARIGPGSYTLTKLHQGNILTSPLWGWAGFAAVVALFTRWRRAAQAFVSRGA